MGGDIGVAQDRGFQLRLTQAMLHDVSDADDAGEVTVLDDWHMADTAVGHLGHDILNRVLRPAGDDLADHEVRRGLLEEGSTVLDQSVYNITLRQDAFDRTAVGADDHSADPIQAKAMDDGLDAGIGPHGGHAVALGGQDILNLHGCPPHSLRTSWPQGARPSWFLIVRPSPPILSGWTTVSTLASGRMVATRLPLAHRIS